MRIRFGDCTFDGEARQLTAGGQPCRLSPKAFHLLSLLVQARPNPVTRDELYRALWPDVVVEPGNLHGLVSEIRAALSPHARGAIRTMHRVGYAFAAPAVRDESPRYAILAGDEEIPLHHGENGIGRDPHDAVVLHGTDVSRHHARLTVNSDGVLLEDLGSKNGTYVGRRRVSAAVAVVPGDEILVGTTRLRLVQLGELPTTATSARGPNGNY